MDSARESTCRIHWPPAALGRHGIGGVGRIAGGTRQGLPPLRCKGWAAVKTKPLAGRQIQSRDARPRGGWPTLRLAGAKPGTLLGALSALALGWRAMQTKPLPPVRALCGSPGNF